LPPVLGALEGVLRDMDSGINRPGETEVEPAEFLRLAALLKTSDPLFAGACYELAASKGTSRPDTPPEEIYRRLEAGTALLAAPGVPLSDSEEVWCRLLKRRCVLSQAQLQERIAQTAADPELARKALARAAELWKDVVATDGQENAPEATLRRDTERWGRALFAIFHEDDALNVLRAGPVRDALVAEVQRRRGDAKGALEAVKAQLAGTRPGTSPDAWAVRALCEVDLGDLTAARASLAGLEAANRGEGAALLPEHEVTAVRAKIASRAK
jgi:hypothetical protein